MPYLDALDSLADRIGAVNTVVVGKNGLIGYNTDAYGFKESLRPLLTPEVKRALVLGTGGASKAVVTVLDQLGIGHTYVSRSPKKGQLSYDDLGPETMAAHHLIINCTPVGTYPQTDQKPTLPYALLTPDHILYDLIYNPPKTAFLQAGEKQGCKTRNGHKMLVLQAEKSWEIWNQGA